MIHSLCTGLVALFLLPLVAGEYLLHMVVLVLLYAYLATAWNILGGYCGYVNFGTAAFFALGAYSSVAMHKLGAGVVFERRFFRIGARTGKTRKHVERDGEQLQRQEDHDQVIGMRHEHHPGRGEPVPFPNARH